MTQKKKTLQSQSLGISQITPQIFLSSHFDTKDIDQLKKLNIKLVVNTTVFQFPHRDIEHNKIKVVTIPYIDSPLIPIPISMLNRGVRISLQYINRKENILVYCKRGVHRSVAMVCCILIGMGMSSDEAFKLVKSNRAIADPEVWYIKRRILKFEKEWVKSERD